MTYPSVAASAEVAVYASWAEILMRMAPWTVVQNKIHPAVAEAAFTPLDISYPSGYTREVVTYLILRFYLLHHEMVRYRLPGVFSSTKDHCNPGVSALQQRIDAVRDSVNLAS
jgi:hypothetical protein